MADQPLELDRLDMTFKLIESVLISSNPVTIAETYLTFDTQAEMNEYLRKKQERKEAKLKESRIEET